MSHVSVLKTKISHVNEEILSRTLEILLNKYPQLEILNEKSARDLFVTIHGDIILKYGSRYIGIHFRDGLKFEYDDWKWRNTVHNILKDFEKIYIAVAVSKVAEKYGYKTKVMQETENKVIYAELIKEA